MLPHVWPSGPSSQDARRAHRDPMLTPSGGLSLHPRFHRRWLRRAEVAEPLPQKSIGNRDDQKRRAIDRVSCTAPGLVSPVDF